jgi:hypothetical protein
MSTVLNIRARGISVVALAFGATALVAAVASAYPLADRWLLAVVLATGFCVVAAKSSRSAVILVMGFLPCLGLIRRLLIFDAGWSSADPLLLVAPAVAIFIFLRTVFIHRTLTSDLLARLIAALLLLTVVEVANPSGPGVAANATGLLFTAAPLLWFFIGNQLADRTMMRAVVLIWMAEAGLVALYGLVQTFSGLPAWDQRWVDVTGYQALYVGQQLRAIGTFASAAEYAVFLAIGTVICVAAVRTRWILPLLALAGLMVYALFLESSRGVVILTLFALLVVVGLRTGRARWALATVVIGLGGAVGFNSAYGSSIASSAATTNNALITHQVGGLTDPLNPDQSTLLLHVQIVVQGIQASLTHPLGAGPGSTNLAGEQGTAVSLGTEVDVSNAFVGGGLVGGFLYVAVLAVALRRVWGLALRVHDFVVLCIAGVLVVALGQWLNGGYYAVAPFIWLAVGFCNREWLALRATAPIGVTAVASPKPMIPRPRSDPAPA